MDAWDAYSEALSIENFSINPAQKAATYFNRGVILAWDGQSDEAIREYRTAIELNPSIYWAYLGLARAIWEKGQYEEAKQLVEKAIPLSPNPGDAYLALGDFSRNEGNLEQARLMYEKALMINPDLQNAKNALEELEKLTQ